MNNKDKLFKIAAEVFDVRFSLININSNSNNVKNWDSLGMINLISEIEQEFSIKFDILEIPELQNIQIIVEFLENKGIKF